MRWVVGMLTIATIMNVMKKKCEIHSLQVLRETFWESGLLVISLSLPHSICTTNTILSIDEQYLAWYSNKWIMDNTKLLVPLALFYLLSITHEIVNKPNCLDFSIGHFSTYSHSELLINLISITVFQMYVAFFDKIIRRFKQLQKRTNHSPLNSFNP